MAAWLSQPKGDRLTNWKDWAIASVVVWLGPLPLGVAVLALAYVLSALFGLESSEQSAHPLAALFIVGFILVFSPLMSWAGVLTALVPAWWLVRSGAGGWASFSALGVAAGTVAGSFFENFATAIAAVFGLLAALTFRWVLFRLRPEIFTAR